MATRTFQHIQKTLTFAAAGNKDLVLRSGNGALSINQTYDDGVATYDIDQEFNCLTLENLSTFQGSYCIEPDPSSNITVDVTTKDDGVCIFQATGSQGSVQELCGVNIIRLRVYLAGAGDVQIDLFKE